MVSLIALKASAENNVYSYGDTIKLYFPYNYRQNTTKSNWVSGDFTGNNKENTIEMLGIGIKYFPNEWFFLDFSNKSSINLSSIGNMTNTALTIPPTYDIVLSELNSYTFTLGHVCNLSKTINVSAGLGYVFNKIRYIETYNTNAQNVNEFNRTFNDLLLQGGIEYKISNRCTFNFSVGYETNTKLNINNSKEPFEYNYSSPYYIEPSISFEF